jgi:hypothetical protein
MEFLMIPGPGASEKVRNSASNSDKERDPLSRAKPAGSGRARDPSGSRLRAPTGLLGPLNRRYFPP